MEQKITNQQRLHHENKHGNNNNNHNQRGESVSNGNNQINRKKTILFVINFESKDSQRFAAQVICGKMNFSFVFEILEQLWRIQFDHDSFVAILLNFGIFQKRFL